MNGRGSSSPATGFCQTQPRRLWVPVLIALLGALLSGCARAEEETTRPAEVPAGYVAVESTLAELGLPPTAAMTVEGEQSFGNAWRTLDLKHDSREIWLDGRRIFLGQGVVAIAGRLWINSIDVEATLRPLLDPRHYQAVLRPVGTIWIDAGHGGRDRGTHNDPLALSEKHLALDVALRLGAILESQGFEIRQTRTEDIYVDIAERGEMSRAADLLVSIHFNAAGNTQARGTEVYALTPAGQASTGGSPGSDDEFPVEMGNATDPWNVLLGFQVQHAMLEKLGTVDRGLKRARFAVLRLTDVPAVLIEAGFLSNDEEAQEIASVDRRREIAESIANGIVTYVNLVQSLDPES